MSTEGDDLLDDELSSDSETGSRSLVLVLVRDGLIRD